MPRTPKPYSPKLVATYFVFYNSVLQYPSVSLTDAAVFSLLASLQRGRPATSPSHAYIATTLKISRSTVVRSIQHLEQLLLLSVYRFSTPDGHKHNSYTVNPQLAADLQASRPALRKTQLKALRTKLAAQPKPPKAKCQDDT